MSVVTVQLGQCGNQIGYQFFDTLMSDFTGHDERKPWHRSPYHSEGLQRFFYDSEDSLIQQTVAGLGKSTVSARAVLVDMEGKVVQNVVSQAKRSGVWKYDEKQLFSKKRGAGNNWADGFHGQGPRVQEDVLERVQREVEKCDAFVGFLTLMSIAGGTGSGVGTRITETLQDNYPNAFLFNHLIWPHGSGEVILQQYNAVLSMAHLYQCADAILISHNDSIKSICSQFATKSQHVSFLDMNKVIADQMSLAFQPAILASQTSSGFGRTLQHLVPHPDYKLLTLRSVPQESEAGMAFSTFNYPSLLTRIRQMLISGSVVDKGINWNMKLPTKRLQSSRHNKSLAALLTVRGKDSGNVDTTDFNNPNLYADWVPPGEAFSLQYHERPFHCQEKTVCLMSNCQTPVKSLDSVVDKAWAMFARRAYVHWYTRYGMTEDEFIDCFAGLEQVIQNYKRL